MPVPQGSGSVGPCAAPVAMPRRQLTAAGSGNLGDGRGAPTIKEAADDKHAFVFEVDDETDEVIYVFNFCVLRASNSRVLFEIRLV